jgi:hypothetical protein
MVEHGVKVVAIENVANEQFYREDEAACRKAAAYLLMDVLMDYGLVEFDTSEMVCLCGCDWGWHRVGCPNHPDSPPMPFGVRAKLRVAAAWPMKN